MKLKRQTLLRLAMGSMLAVSALSLAATPELNSQLSSTSAPVPAKPTPAPSKPSRAKQVTAKPKHHPTAVPIQLVKPVKFHNRLLDVAHKYKKSGQMVLTFRFARPLGKRPSSFVTKDPKRLVFDFKGTQNALKTKTDKINMGPIYQYSTVQSADETRFVVELKKHIQYRSKVRGNKLVVTIGQKSPKETVLSRKPNSIIEHHKRVGKKHDLKNIDFRRTKNGSAQVVLHLSDNHIPVDIERRSNNLFVDLIHSYLPRRLQRKLDVTDFDTPVSSVSLHQVGKDIQVKINSRKEFTHLAYQVNNDFVIDISPISNNRTANGLKKKTYHGERISLNFQNIQVRAIIQLLAEFTGLNIVTSDRVNGSVTLRLHHVPWDQALDIILKARGLAERKIGNVLLIAPASEMAAQEQKELQAEKQLQQLAPLHSEFIQVNYAKASDISALIRSTGANAQSLLSSRGFMSVDDRTNTLWIRDTAKNLEEVRQLVQRLDVPVRQVLIEARVVKVNRNFERDIGVRFGVTKNNIPLTGTLEGANTIRNGGNASTANRLNVDLPAGAATSHIGVALANLGRGYLLDLELSAMEAEGKGNIVSSPRLITSNKQEAVIEDGEEIPYQQVTSSGATSVSFKKAVLGIKVTPQITPDNKIILDIQVNQDSPNSREVLGVPAIDTQMVKTQALVDNGGTIVLGGIYKQSHSNGFQRVPFFSSIPIIGHLFRERSVDNTESELLIFITPKVITQSAFHQA